MPGKNIVVIGGGFGGAAAARTIRSLLGREHEVTLIDRSRRTHLCGSFPLLIVGEREAAKVSRSLGSLVNRGIRYMEAEVEEIDTVSRTVKASGATLEFDYLVVAAGAVYDWDAVPGSRSAHSFFDLDSARRLRRRLSSFNKGRIVLAVASVPYKCPPAPFETAMVLDWAFRRRGVRGDVEIDVFTPEPVPLAVAGPEAGHRQKADMEGRGIHVHTGAGVVEVADPGREVTFSDGTSTDADLVITIPTHRAPPLVGAADLAGPSGWVSLSPESLETDVPGVYAVGDVTAIPMANGRPLPKAGVFASAEGETAGRNIAAAINGDEPSVFPGIGHCFILYGGDTGGMVQGEFLAAGKPNVSLQPPSAAGFQAKEQFEQDWRRFRI